jgi:hypothetical protein
MTTSFEIDETFLERESIPFDPDDLRYGFERGWLRPPTVVHAATREVERGSDDRVMLELASLLQDDLDQVAVVLAQLDEPDEIHDPGLSARKWLYLQLKAAFEMRRDLADPLEVVEQIYADFDYPPAIEGFVRYMPVRSGQPLGEAGLLDRWSAFLRRERESLRRSRS